MNKLRLLAVASITYLFSVGYAQEGSTTLINYTTLEASVKRSDSQIENEKKNVKSNTWIYRAKVMTDIANVYNQYIAPGAAASTMMFALGSANQIETITEDGQTFEIHYFDRVKVKVSNGVIQSYEETDPIVKNPLDEAVASINKAIELNTDGKADKKIADAIEEVLPLLKFSGVEKIRNSDYNSAVELFKNFFALSKTSYYEAPVDTNVLYFTAYSAFLDEKYETAKTYAQETKSYNYDEPYNYYILSKSCFELGDSTAGLEYLKEGFQKYADNEYIINELINFYLLKDKAEEALEYIGVAKKNSPENATYLFAEGTLYDKMGKPEKAEESYKQALEIDPEFFNANFNLSVLYYNTAVKLFGDADKEKDDKKYEALKAEALTYIEKAVKPMEDALSIAGDDTKNEVLENLKTYYFRLRGESEEYENKYNDVLKQLGE